MSAALLHRIVRRSVGGLIMVQFEEIKHFGPENFLSLVDAPSTKRKSSTTKDEYGRVTERLVFYKGSRILGMQVRNVNGYRYYIRK